MSQKNEHQIKSICNNAYNLSLLHNLSLHRGPFTEPKRGSREQTRGQAEKETHPKAPGENRAVGLAAMLQVWPLKEEARSIVQPQPQSQIREQIPANSPPSG